MEEGVNVDTLRSLRRRTTEVHRAAATTAVLQPLAFPASKKTLQGSVVFESKLGSQSPRRAYEFSEPISSLTSSKSTSNRAPALSPVPVCRGTTP